MSDQASSRRVNRPLLKRRRLTISACIVVVAAGIGAAAMLNWPTAKTAGANPDDPAQVSLGRTVYVENCVSCHGGNLEGQANWRIRKPDGKLPAPPHDEAGHTWHHPTETLFKITKLGVKPPLAPEGYKSDMPAFGDILTDEQIWAVLAFIMNDWSPEVRRRQERRNPGAKR